MNGDSCNIVEAQIERRKATKVSKHVLKGFKMLEDGLEKIKKILTKFSRKSDSQIGSLQNYFERIVNRSPTDAHSFGSCFWPVKISRKCRLKYIFVLSYFL